MQLASWGRGDSKPGRFTGWDHGRRGSRRPALIPVGDALRCGVETSLHGGSEVGTESGRETPRHCASPRSVASVEEWPRWAKIARAGCRLPQAWRRYWPGVFCRQVNNPRLAGEGFDMGLSCGLSLRSARLSPTNTMLKGHNFCRNCPHRRLRNAGRNAETTTDVP